MNRLDEIVLYKPLTQHAVETKTSKLLLGGKVLPGHELTVDVENGEIVVR